MANFISLEVVNAFNAASQATQGTILIPVDKITQVSQAVGGANIVIRTSESATSLWTFVLSTSQGAVAAAAPVLTGEQDATWVKKVNYALTANPGGVNAKVQLGSDFTGGVPTAPGYAPLATNLQVYVFSAVYTP
tara:strand:+ start:1251 stop:1655 length:405 start_codon:yes stop_codon:yes gene_type:complete